MADARDIIRDFLDQFDLTDQRAADGGTIFQWASRLLTEGATADQIKVEVREQPGYRERFKAVFEREARGLPPISPAQVLQFEQRRAELFRSYGLPRGFYDEPEDAVNDLVNDVSIAELQSRVVGGYARLQATDPAIRREFQELNGIADGDLVAYFLDPHRALPLLEQQITQAEIGAAARSAGFGAIDRATSLGLQEAGVTGDQARQGFVELQQLAPALQSLDESTRIAGVFGTDGDAVSQVRTTIGRRAGLGQSSSGRFAQDEEGFAGVGSV